MRPLGAHLRQDCLASSQLLSRFPVSELQEQIEVYREGMEQGDIDAALSLGVLLVGDSEVRDLPGAIDAYKRGIELGDTRAALNLGNLLLREPEVRDVQGAIQAYRQGIELGDPDAALNLGNLLTGHPEARDLEAAAEAFRQGVALGDPRSALNLGNLLAADPEVRDVRGAIRAYRMALEHGVAKAGFNLGLLLSEDSEARDLEGAVEAYRESIRLGDREAAVNLGQLLIIKPEVRDVQAAIDVFEEGLKLGEPDAALNLSLLGEEQSEDGDIFRPLLTLGEHMLVARGMEHEQAGRKDEALADYERAAELGSADGGYLAALLKRREKVASLTAPPRSRQSLESGDARAITTLEDLEAHLASLPPPKPGHTRVYRGQRRDHGSLIPASLRPGAPNPQHLAVTTTAITRYLLDVIGVDHPEIEDAPLRSIWTWAIVQHYGPGSPYLDVTHSLDVALWFALHEAKRVEIGGPVGAFGMAQIDGEVPLDLHAYTFEQASDSGYLYVFDLPPADPTGGPWNNQLVDLATAPELFSESPRVKAQAACLILAPGSESEDMSSLLVTEPLEVGWPMSGSSCASLTVPELFPPPGIDKWYARLLALPLVHIRDPDSSRLLLTLPLPVTLYGADDNALRNISRRVHALLPARLFEHLTKRDDDGAPVYESFSPAEDTTVLLLHHPICLEAPDAAGEGWNHGIAASDLPTTAPVLDLDTGVRTEAPLSNVFVEFSPLEHPGWGEKDEGMNFCRGAYLERDGDDRFRLWVYHQSFPDYRITGLGPLEIEYVPAANRFMVDGSDDLGEVPVANTVFLAILSLLRELAGKPLVSPVPWLYAPGEAAIVGFSKETNVLVEAERSHLVYDGEAREPLGAVKMAGTVKLSCPDGWAAVDPGEAQRHCDDHGSRFAED